MTAKPPIAYLNFGKKTAKRVAWEAWEFTVTSPHLIAVTNASYGYLKDEHTYTVGVAVQDGVAVPAECDCPADMHREEYDCKHKVALAAVGGPTVLNAAVGFESPSTNTGAEKLEATTAADKLQADGGLPAATSRAEEDGCEDCMTDFPCWPCYRDGRRGL